MHLLISLSGEWAKGSIFSEHPTKLIVIIKQIKIHKIPCFLRIPLFPPIKNKFCLNKNVI